MADSYLIDVSHILGWQGNLTGIERVEFYIIKYYFEHSSASFIAWSDKRRSFINVSRTDVQAKIIDRRSEDELRKGSIRSGLFYRLIREMRRAVSSHRITTDQHGPIIILAGLWDNQSYIQGLLQLSSKTPIIHVVFDMIPLVQKAYVVDWLPEIYGEYMYSILPKCSRILAISEVSAQDTAEVLKQKKLRVPPIETFRLGDDITRAPQAKKPEIVIPGDFILSVGTIEARKNHKLLYAIYKEAQSIGMKLPRIIIVGRRGWKTEKLQQAIADDPEVKDRVVILDKVTDANLRWLYENCLMTVFPSFYEGWGLPIAESLNYGKVTIASNTSSMPEVGGNFADYFTPTSADELLKLITKYLDSTTRKGREEYIRKNYKPVSWENAATDFAKKAVT